jgi:hypothetical protein
MSMVPRRLLTFLAEHAPRMYLFQMGWRPLLGGPVVVWTDPTNRRRGYTEMGAYHVQMDREWLQRCLKV